MSYVHYVDGRRSRSVATRQAILVATRELVAAAADPPTVGAVAGRAGVSRLTVYQHFGSHRGLLEALAATVAAPGSTAPDTLEAAVRAACERWAGDPQLFRRLPGAGATSREAAHGLAAGLAAADRLRPGCSVREAEDVIALVTSFAAFDGLHHDGRRSTSSVAEILTRMAGCILNPLT